MTNRNNPVDELERAVEALAAYAVEHAGELEEDLPRVRQAEYVLLGVRERVQVACEAARTEARFQATMRRLEGAA